ncbi:class I SAM-dependent methyltransferase [Nocardia puris]|uniref:Methyltransferase family protein n=1 Tax=Nocardia puris TaxID=208602 RepID=A0A366DE72_9NOCA|nr:class I SAM-dependent methyltransferase [Nocardia puris]RBO88296.1 methyltransferase family protein [Nocardia puris]
MREGYLTRALVRRGAEFVHGVDTCAEFAAAARSHPEAHPQTSVFHLADVADLPVADRSVDLVVANRLPHGIIEPGKRFREFARVLRPSGRLIVLSMHPCFYVARADRNRPEARGFDLDAYFGTRTVEQPFQVAGKTSPAASVQTFFSLEDHVRMLTDAGFAVTGLREPRPTAEQRRDPWWRENFPRPLFLLLDCVRFR